LYWHGLGAWMRLNGARLTLWRVNRLAATRPDLSLKAYE
jgi:hypothetical protein